MVGISPFLSPPLIAPSSAWPRGHNDVTAASASAVAYKTNYTRAHLLRFTVDKSIHTPPPPPPSGPRIIVVYVYSLFLFRICGVNTNLLYRSCYILYIMIILLLFRVVILSSSVVVVVSRVIPRKVQPQRRGTHPRKCALILK